MVYDLEFRESCCKKLGFLLKKIYSSKVALEPEHDCKKKLLMFFVDHFINFCCETSSVFKILFHGLYLTGSYFEGLRVKSATEFDIDIIFAFPENIAYKVTELDEIPSFAKYNVTDSSNLSSENSELKTFFDSENYLHASYLMKWFQSLIDSFIFHFHSTYPGLSEIRTTHSGPARTIKLLFNSEWISVDLVPVISIAAKKLLKCTFCNVANFQEESLAYCFLVPKPVKSDLSSLLSNEVLERVWRVHLPEMEKNIIQKKNTLKKLIKLMKYLRDQENWPICSYFIKVMAYWLVKEHPDAKWWKDSKLGLLFVEFLKAMQGHLDKKFLRHILYPAFNLFHSLNDRTMFNMKQRIQTIISQIEMNPKYILRIYNVPILIHRSL